jgi:hypothetical protein
MYIKYFNVKSILLLKIEFLLYLITQWHPMSKLLLILALMFAIYDYYWSSPANQIIEYSMPQSDLVATNNGTVVEATIAIAQEIASWVAYHDDRVERIALWSSAYHHQVMMQRPPSDNPDYTGWYHNYQEVRAFIGLQYKGTTFYLWRAVFSAEHHRLMYMDTLVATPAYVAS